MIDDRAAFETWLRARGLSRSTTKLYGRIAGRVIADLVDDPLVWLVDHVQEDTPAGTRSSLLGACANLVRFRTGVEDVQIPKLAPMQKRVKYGRDALSPADVDAFSAAVEESGTPAAPRCVLRLLPLTGLRVGELCAVELDKVVLRQRGSRRPGIDVVGKGNKLRWVPLTESALEVLDDYTGEAKAAGVVLERWLFPSSKSSRMHVTPKTVRTYLQDLRSSLPMTARDVTPHVLRHTFATRLLAAGVNPVVIQTILGHASMETTRIYLHPSRDMIAEAFSKL